MSRSQEFKPQLAKDLQIRFLKEDERGKFYIVGRKGQSSFLRIHEVGKDIMGRLDGTATVAELKRTLEQKGIDADISRFIYVLGEEGLLQNFEPHKKKTDDKFGTWYFPIARFPERALGAVHHALLTFFRPKAWLVFTSFNVAALLLFAITLLTGAIRLKTLVNLEGSAFLAVIAYTLLLAPALGFVHELAHAIACLHYGGRPGEMGIAFYLIIPFFYVDTSDAWILERRQSIMIFLAGPMTTLFIGNLAFLLYYLVQGLAGDILLLIAFWSYLSAFISINPVLETDGYYILQSSLRFPNLNSHSWSYAFLWLKHKTKRLTEEEYADSITSYSKQERKVLSLYIPCVLLVNVALICFMGVFGYYLATEYVAITGSIIDTFPNISTSILATWIIQSLYAFLLVVMIPFRLARKLGGRTNRT